MNSVTGPRLAATLARRGGLGVLPQDLPLQELDEAIRWVKAQPGRVRHAARLSPDATVADALELLPPVEGHGIVQVLLDVAQGDILGCIAARRASRRRSPTRGSATSCTAGIASLDADDVDTPAPRVRPHGRRRPRVRPACSSTVASSAR